ncbi:aorsin endoprotease precursor [Cordyceps militaris]|uniref:Aorsin endoprotease n=1 Tax=Cordyceps militaris TaxID=73501 RepID=A0A2H4SH51_CORMI|nr:aorsin endoprotease precursor [Cordyceps militaris]
MPAICFTLLSAFLCLAKTNAKAPLKKRFASPEWREEAAIVGSTSPMRLHLALSPQRRWEDAEVDLMRVSDPQSLDFGNFWTSTEVVAKFAPAAEVIRETLAWLGESGIRPQGTRLSNDRSWIQIDTTAKQAERLLGTKVKMYSHASVSRAEPRFHEYNIPEHLDAYIDFVMPLALETTLTASRLPANKQIVAANAKPIIPLAMPSSKEASGYPFTLANCHKYTTPDCLRALYGIPSNITSHPKSSIGVLEVSWVSWLPADLDAFADAMNLATKGRRPIVVPINGGYWQNTTQIPFLNMEADLDFEYVMALTHPTPVINYQLGDMFVPGTLNNLLAAFDRFYCGALNSTFDGTYPSVQPGGYNQTTDCGTIVNPTKVLSISYAWDEASYPNEYLRRQCLEFLKLGLQGVTVVVSSADCGPAGQSCQCTDAPNNTSRFRPTTPASCPYVTVVGGTQLPPNASVLDQEVAFYHTAPSGKISSSGGGFSDVFSAPSWQVPHTQGYISQQDHGLGHLYGRFNPHGRGIPDVAASAANYVVVVNGQLQTVLGTSASAPTFASLVSKLNDARLSMGKRPVGFMNPVLYKRSEALNDIVKGHNYGCGGDGFPADKGWDPVTGLGTPSYERLWDVYKTLP